MDIVRKSPTTTDPKTKPTGQTRVGRDGSRWFWLLIAIAALGVVVVVSLAVGSRNIGLGVVFEALVNPDGTDQHLVIRELRVPRTLLGLLVGAAFGVAGAVIQALTRNPLADPGILGVNAGAAFAVVLGVSLLGVTRIHQYLAFGFIGAIAATLLVYGIASRGIGGATPLRLTLVGVALSAVLNGLSSGLAMLDIDTFNRMRFWGVGSITDRPPGTVTAIVVFIAVGLAIALLCAVPLNAMSLGEDTARSLGIPTGVVRAVCVVAVTLLCGAATAAVGPIGFIGLMVPHVVRWLTGPDQRWIIPFSMILGPILLLVADIAGRLVVWPAELQVGVVTAFIGAPVLIFLVRRTRASGL